MRFEKNEKLAAVRASIAHVFISSSIADAATNTLAMQQVHVCAYQQIIVINNSPKKNNINNYNGISAYFNNQSTVRFTTSVGAVN